MKKSNKTVMVTVLLISVLMFVPSVATAEEVLVVIVNSSNPVDSLSLADLKKLFLSDKSRWDSGKAVATVMLAPGAPERAAFLKVVCHMSDAEFAKYFVQAAFTGKDVSPPKEVGSASAIKVAVGSSPGAIGVVKASEVSPADTTVKAVKVDGSAASDASYKLKM